jgi:predicted nucleic acid binding AN1-type Zn finger protein
MINFNLIEIRRVKLLTREESWWILKVSDRLLPKTKMRNPVKLINSGKRCKGRGCSGSKKRGKK